MNNVLLDHFFSPKEPFFPPPRLRPHQSVPPLKTDEIAAALSKCSPTSASGPDGIPYSTWKQVNKINTSILLQILAPLVLLGYHPAWLKSSNGVVLDKPAQPSHQSHSAFRIIVLICTFSKILERIIAARLLTAARLRGLWHPNQCGSLPGLSTYHACLTLTNEVKTLQRPRLKVSSLFVDIKAGFENVDNNTVARMLSEGCIRLYLVSWVSSFLGQRSCTLIFQVATGTPAPVNLAAPQGSPISPLLFLLYVAPLHFPTPLGLMISYVADFALTVASRPSSTVATSAGSRISTRGLKARRPTSASPFRSPKRNYSTGGPRARGTRQSVPHVFRLKESILPLHLCLVARVVVHSSP